MINLHNHSTHSDGLLTPEEIIRAAVEAGLTHVGISDHFRTAKLGATAQYVLAENLGEYIATLRALAARYASQITVLVGLEIDFSERTPMEQLWAQGFSRTPLNDLDYLLFEYVEDPQWKGLPLSALLAYRRWICVPVGLAHTFFSACFAGRVAAQELAHTLEQHEIFVELCPSSRYCVPSPLTGELIPYYRYPDAYTEALFTAFAMREVRFSIGSDTHDRSAEVAAIDDTLAFLREKGLTDRLVTERYWPRYAQGQRPS